MKSEFLSKCYPEFEPELLEEIEKHAISKTFKNKEYVVKQGQYIKSLPIIQDGCIKVFCQEGIKEFLLYFIASGESCIQSFTHISREAKASFSAVAELDSTLLLLPVDKFQLWIKKYPSINSIIINSYQKHYNELLDTTKQIICHNLEERLIDYLKNKSNISKSKLLSISHQSIANDLGTSREVVSRLMKSQKLDEFVIQEGRQIRVR